MSLHPYSQTKTKAPPATGSPITGAGLLQRACACGQHTPGGGECAGCRKKRLGLQRKAVRQDGPQTAPPLVHDVLRTPGQPLDPAARAYMEPRFGQDFSRVRVHTGARAAASAQAVGALAYTVGRDVVFGKGQYAPGTASGRSLLAHELVHVIQQAPAASTGAAPTRISQPSDPGEQEADRLSRSAIQAPTSAGLSQVNTLAASPVLARRVIPRLVNCPPNTNGAPADPVAELTAAVDRGEMMASMTALLLRLEAAFTRSGMADPASTINLAFDARFGPVPAVPGGFLNRLTGRARPSQEIARAEEMELMANRFDLIAGLLGRGFMHYRCNNGSDAFGGCVITSCPAGIDAWSCTAVNAVFLCPSFWAIADNDSRATLLIHECSHVIWERVIHGAGGPGGNFRHAECYASLVADIFGSVPGTPVCNAP